VSLKQKNSPGGGDELIYIIYYSSIDFSFDFFVFSTFGFSASAVEEDSESPPA